MSQPENNATYIDTRQDWKRASRTQGKGDSARPLSVSNEEFAENWDRVFGKQPG